MLSEVAAKSKEVKSGTETTISCVITGLNDATASVVWQDSEGQAVTGDNFTPAEGTQEGGKQTTTLLVKGAAVTDDKAYNCQVTSGTDTNSAASDTTVNLDVYGENQDSTFLLYCMIRTCTAVSYL